MRKEGGAMKRLLLLGVGSALMFTMGGVGPAQADNGPHVATNLATSVTPDGCAGCHRVHSAKTDMLTIDVQPALCYTCHGGAGTGAATDVENGVGYVGNYSGDTNPIRTATKAGALRGGGFRFALIGASEPVGQKGLLDAGGKQMPGVIPVGASEPVTSSHSVDGSTQTAWGQGEIGVTGTLEVGNPIQLRCGSCHDPHGNGNYRILKGEPEQSMESPLSTLDPTAAPITPVFTGIIADASVKTYTTENYWSAADASAPAYIANVSQWCATCHTRYLATRDKLGANTTPAMRSRADSGDDTFMYRHTSNDNKAGGKNCITCHVSHGSNATTGEFSGAALLTPGANGVETLGDTGTGDSRLLRIDNRGTCIMCHEK